MPHFPSPSSRPSSQATPWRQGELVEVTITDVSDSGDGVGRFDQRVVFVPDTVTGDRALVRLLHVKPQYANGKVQKLLRRSPHRSRPECFVADKCGGCQWQHITYDHQLDIKRNQVIQALERIGGFTDPPVDPVLAAPSPLAYRNKATYPVGLAPSTQSPTHPSTSALRIGYYQKGSHQIVNLNQCPIQDERLNPLLAEVKQDIQQQGWSIYDETQHTGQIRHLALRVGRRTGELLLTLVVRDRALPQIEAQAEEWLHRYPNLVGVCLNHNPQRTNAIFGATTHCVAGRPYLRELFAGCQFHIQADTFFQVYTEQAEALLDTVLAALQLTGTETVVDAYCGIGTLSLPIAQRVRQVIGLEVQPTSVQQATENAHLNGLDNLQFHAGAVEDRLLECLGQGTTEASATAIHPDIVLLDPPRKGCDRKVLESLRHLQPERLVYISCNPATLARDLKHLCEDGLYQLTRVQPADFFPQTAHVEAAAFLHKANLAI